MDLKFHNSRRFVVLHLSLDFRRTYFTNAGGVIFLRNYFIPSTCCHWVPALVSGTTEQLLHDWTHYWHATYELHVLFGGYSLNGIKCYLKALKRDIKPVSVSPQICSRGSPHLMFSRHEEMGLNRSEWLRWSNVTVLELHGSWANC